MATANPSNPRAERATLRTRQMQDWLNQPQGYVVGLNGQHTDGDEEKNKDRETVLKKYLRDVEEKVASGKGKGEGEGGDNGGKSACKRKDLLCLGAWTKG